MNAAIDKVRALAKGADVIWLAPETFEKLPEPIQRAYLTKWDRNGYRLFGAILKVSEIIKP